MKPTPLILLGLTSALLASCNGGNTTPPAPTQPTVGVSQDMAQLGTLTQTASGSLRDLGNPSSTDQNADLAAILKMLGLALPSMSPASTLNPAQYGQVLLNTLTNRSSNALQAQYLPGDVILPSGTVTIPQGGQPTYSLEPRTGFIVINEQEGTRLEINWHVNGAPSVYLKKNLLNTVEVPTNATLSATRNGAPMADLKFSMTPGDCLQERGPTALTLSGWAGEQANPAAQVNLNYAWTATGIVSSGSATLQTKTRAASARYDLNLMGTTANRCDLLRFAFTPSSLSASAAVNLPDQQAEGNLSITNISNVTVTPDITRVTNPFKGITGTLNSTMKYGGQVALTASGPIADGNDLDLLPGDQVSVTYVKNGVLVTKSLPEALKDLFGK